MGIWKERSLRKSSGGRYHPARKKKARDVAAEPLLAKIATERQAKIHRMRGGEKRTHLTGEVFANLMENGKARKVKVISVVENPASRHFIRQNILTKGAIVKTDAGMIKITSRSSRDGTVNAILIK